MKPDVPPWKFWHPLPFWHVLVIFALTNVVMSLIIVGLREGLGQMWLPTAAAGGAGGVAGYFIVRSRAMAAMANEPSGAGSATSDTE